METAAVQVSAEKNNAKQLNLKTQGLRCFIK